MDKIDNAITKIRKDKEQTLSFLSAEDVDLWLSNLGLESQDLFENVETQNFFCQLTDKSDLKKVLLLALMRLDDGKKLTIRSLKRAFNYITEN